jgi:hypothetical protein
MLGFRHLHKKEDCQWGDWFLVKFGLAFGGRGDGRYVKSRGDLKVHGCGRGRGHWGIPKDGVDEMDVHDEEQVDLSKDILVRKCDEVESSVQAAGDVVMVDGKMIMLENGAYQSVLVSLPKENGTRKEAKENCGWYC